MTKARDPFKSKRPYTYVEKPLTYRKQRFIEEMLIDPTNKTAAAKRAGYSIATARQQATQLMNDPRIKATIEAVGEVAAERLGITKQRVLQELAAIGFANVKSLTTQDAEGNTNVNLAHLPDELTSPIQEIKIITAKNGKSAVQTTSIKMADKRAALIDLAKMMGWHRDEVKVTGTLTLEQLIEDSYKLEKQGVDILDVEADPVPQLEAFSN